MTPSEPTVYLLDDEPAVLRGVGRLLRASGFRTAEFTDAGAFLRTLSPDASGCLVLDFAMRDLDGLQVQDELNRRGAVLPIIFLTGRADVPMTVLAMKAGAAEFLTKPVDERRLIDAVRDALARGLRARAQVDDLTCIMKRLALLTPRERQVMDLVVAGKLNKQVGQELGASEKTIKVHRARVMEKMRAESLADLVRMAVRIRETPG